MNDFLTSSELNTTTTTIKQLFHKKEPFNPKTSAEAVYYSDGERLSEKDFLLKRFIENSEIDRIINYIFN